jgi:hypothetical protein
MFLKQKTNTSKPTKLKLFIIPKLTCTQFAHSFKNILLKYKNVFMLLMKEKQKIKLTS